MDQFGKNATSFNDEEGEKNQPLPHIATNHMMAWNLQKDCELLAQRSATKTSSMTRLFIKIEIIILDPECISDFNRLIGLF